MTCAPTATRMRDLPLGGRLNAMPCCFPGQALRVADERSMTVASRSFRGSPARAVLTAAEGRPHAEAHRSRAAADRQRKRMVEQNRDWWRHRLSESLAATVTPSAASAVIAAPAAAAGIRHHTSRTRLPVSSIRTSAPAQTTPTIRTPRRATSPSMRKPACLTCKRRFTAPMRHVGSKQIRPVITDCAEVMDRLFPGIP
jgi:hypothetical protein